MSSLIRQSHATNEQPLWAASSTSGSIGQVSATQYNLVLPSQAPANADITSDGTTTGNMCLQASSQVRFTKPGVSTGNSGISISAQGSNLDGMTLGGSLVVKGPLNTVGITMQNAQYVSILDGAAPTPNESLRITAGTSGAPYPDGAFANFQTGLNGAFGFGVVGQLPSTILSAGGIGNYTDEFIVGGQVSSQSVQTTQVFVGNQDPAKAVIGTATLTAGTITINTTQCAGPTTMILLTRTDINASTSLGMLRVRSRNVGNFTIEACGPSPANVVDVGDLSTFDWLIINPSTTP